jgi:hypothetical protein
VTKIISLLLICIFTRLARSQEPATAESAFPADVFLEVKPSDKEKGICSGFVMSDQGRRFLVTAHHCNKNLIWAHEKARFTQVQTQWPKLYTFFYGNLIKTTEQSISYFYSRDFQRFGKKDIDQSEISTVRLTQTSEYEKAKLLPQIGDKLTVSGFPKNWPLVMENCVYQGYVLNPLDETLVSHKIFCPTAPDVSMTDGLSGSAVRNIDGEVVGVINTALFHKGYFLFDDIIEDYQPRSIRSFHATAILNENPYELTLTFDSDGKADQIRGVFPGSQVMNSSAQALTNKSYTPDFVDRFIGHE